MFDNGLKTSLWVSAEIRRCDALFLPITILHKGDEARGLVLIKHYIAGQGCQLYDLQRNSEGALGWHHPLGENLVEESKADAYIARQRAYDEDLWVIEVEDPKQQYSPQ